MKLFGSKRNNAPGTEDNIHITSIEDGVIEIIKTLHSLTSITNTLMDKYKYLLGRDIDKIQIADKVNGNNTLTSYQSNAAISVIIRPNPIVQKQLDQNDVMIKLLTDIKAAVMDVLTAVRANNINNNQKSQQNQKTSFTTMSNKQSKVYTQNLKQLMVTFMQIANNISKISTMNIDTDKVIDVVNDITHTADKISAIHISLVQQLTVERFAKVFAMLIDEVISRLVNVDDNAESSMDVVVGTINKMNDVTDALKNVTSMVDERDYSMIQLCVRGISNIMRSMRMMNKVPVNTKIVIQTLRRLIVIIRKIKSLVIQMAMVSKIMQFSNMNDDMIGRIKGMMTSAADIVNAANPIAQATPLDYKKIIGQIMSATGILLGVVPLLKIALWVTRKYRKMDKDGKMSMDQRLEILNQVLDTAAKITSTIKDAADTITSGLPGLVKTRIQLIKFRMMTKMILKSILKLVKYITDKAKDAMEQFNDASDALAGSMDKFPGLISKIQGIVPPDLKPTDMARMAMNLRIVKKCIKAIIETIQLIHTETTEDKIGPNPTKAILRMTWLTAALIPLAMVLGQVSKIVISSGLNDFFKKNPIKTLMKSSQNVLDFYISRKGKKNSLGITTGENVSIVSQIRKDRVTGYLIKVRALVAMTAGLLVIAYSFGELMTTMKKFKWHGERTRRRRMNRLKGMVGLVIDVVNYINDRATWKGADGKSGVKQATFMVLGLTAIVVSLTIMAKKLLLLGALSLPLLIFSPFIMLGVVIVIGLIAFTRKMVNVILGRGGAANIVILDLLLMIGKLTLVVISLTIMSTFLLVFGAISTKLVSYSLYILGALLLITVFSAGLVGLLYVLSQTGLLTKVSGGMLDMLMIFGFIALAAIELCIVAGSLILLGVIGQGLIAQAGNIAKTMLIIVLFGAAVAGIGAAGGLLIPLYLAATTVMLAMTVVVLAVLAIAAMLRLLAEIELDQKLIMQKVDEVLDTVGHIYQRITKDFNLNGSTSASSTNKGLLDKIENSIPGPLQKMFNSYVQVISVLAGASILVISVISVLSILLIAGMLRLLQVINLDRASIMANVNIILDTVYDINDLVFRDVKTQENNNKQPEANIDVLLNRIGYGFVSAIGSLLSAVSLVAAVISVAAILLMAGMLRLLQIINLDPKRIKSNVDLIIGLVLELRNMVFEGPAEMNKDWNPNPNDGGKGLFLSMLKGIGTIAAPLANMVINIIGALGSAVMLVLSAISVGIILGISWMIRKIAEEDMDKIARGKDNALKILSANNDIMNSVFENSPTADDIKSEEITDNNIVQLASWLLKPFAMILNSIMSIGYLAISMLAIYLIKKVADNITSLSSIDQNAIGNGVTSAKKTLKSANDIIDAVFHGDYDDTPSEPKDNSLWGQLKSLSSDVLQGIANIASMPFALIKGLMVLGSTGYIFLAIGMLSKITQSIGNLMKFNVNVDQATARARTVMSAATTITNSVLANNANLNKIDGDIIDQLDVISQIMTSMGDIAKNMNDIHLWSDQYNAISSSISRIDKIINQAVKVFINISWNRIHAASGHADMIKGFIDKMNNIMDSMGNIDTNPDKTLSIISGTLNKLSAFYVKMNQQETIDPKKAHAMYNFTKNMTNMLAYLGNTKINAASIQEKIKLLTDVSNTVKQFSRDGGKLIEQFHTLIKQLTGQDSGKTYQAGFNGIFQNLKDMIGGKINNVVGPAVTKLKSLLNPMKELGNVTKEFNNALKDFSTPGTSGGVNIKESQAAMLSIQDMVNTLNNISKISVNEAGVMKKIRLLNEVNATLQSFGHVEKSDVKNSEALVNNYIRFIDRIDRARMESLKTTEKLMKHWADLSMSINGNFDKLAESINEHIMPALKKLDKTMDGVTESQEAIIKLMSADNQADNGGGAAGSMPDGAGSMPTGDTGSMPGGDNGAEAADTTTTGGPLIKSTKAAQTSSNPTDEIVMQLAKIAQALNR